MKSAIKQRLERVGARFLGSDVLSQIERTSALTKISQITLA